MMNLQELSMEVYGFEIYECPICGYIYSEFESHESSECPEYEAFVSEVLMRMGAPCKT